MLDFVLSIIMIVLGIACWFVPIIPLKIAMFVIMIIILIILRIRWGT